MVRARLLLASTLLFVGAPFMTAPSHAIQCSQVLADACATYVFACERLAYHNVNLAACHLD
jgi:hypothetical protein